ncbi:MAG TPA: 6-phosphogluconolactonase [Pelagibacterium sp.]|nr:6-phosphogluconolactonase [Pelagibacterium sp.]
MVGMQQAASEDAGERRVDRLKVRSFATREEMAQRAADDIAAGLRAALAKKQQVRMVFAAAPSQADTLAAVLARDNIDWARVTAFHMDEYIGLPERAPQRFALWLDAHVFSRAPFREVVALRPDPDPIAAASAYAARLAEAEIDLVILGVGVNGHLAFNDPPVANFEDPQDVKIVELDAVCRQQQVDDGGFATVDAVPSSAITLTIPRLLRADALYCVVPGAAKRAAIKAMLHGPLAPACPASILRTQPHCTLYLDRESDPDASRTQD